MQLFTVFLIRFKVVKNAKVEPSYGPLNFGNCTEGVTKHSTCSFCITKYLDMQNEQVHNSSDMRGSTVVHVYPSTLLVERVVRL